MKRMLINATQPEELRVALVDGQKLYNLDIEVPSREQKKANIYKAKVTRIEPSLEAVFVDYGSERHGFLPFKEISANYLGNAAQSRDRANAVKDAIKEGQEVIIQVEKEERGGKGAALTTKVGLAGRYLVLMPTDARAGGVSRRIEGDDRDEVREALSLLNLPEGMGVIVRTAGVGRSQEELQWDLDYLLNVWGAIQKASSERAAPFLIYQESNVIIRALRDYYSADIGEIIIDEESVFQQASNFLNQIMPSELRKLRNYSESVPLFNRYQIESQIESAFQREVKLPSGGSVVIDHAEALTAIDINSAKATKGSDIEETALNTNVEAADEIARQLRLRDLGGLIVIDFIDMAINKNQREVEYRLRQALRLDRARVRIGRISRFGLLEMSRQRLRPSLGESSQITCPRCSGHGNIRSIESLALAVLRLIEEEAIKENSARVIAQVPVDVATFLINEKRDSISEIEARNTVDTFIVPNYELETPNYIVERIRLPDVSSVDSKNSYEFATYKKDTFIPEEHAKKATPEAAAVREVAPNAPMPNTKKPGLLTRLFRALFGDSTKKPKKKRGSAKRSRRSASNQSRRRENERNNKQRNRNRRKPAQERAERKNNENQKAGGNNGRGNGSANAGGRRGRQEAAETRAKRGNGRRRNSNRDKNQNRSNEAREDQAKTNARTNNQNKGGNKGQSTKKTTNRRAQRQDTSKQDKQQNSAKSAAAPANNNVADKPTANNDISKQSNVTAITDTPIDIATQRQASNNETRVQTENHNNVTPISSTVSHQTTQQATPDNDVSAATDKQSNVTAFKDTASSEVTTKVIEKPEQTIPSIAPENHNPAQNDRPAPANKEQRQENNFSTPSAPHKETPAADNQKPQAASKHVENTTSTKADDKNETYKHPDEEKPATSTPATNVIPSETTAGLYTIVKPDNTTSPDNKSPDTTETKANKDEVTE